MLTEKAIIIGFNDMDDGEDAYIASLHAEDCIDLAGVFSTAIKHILIKAKLCNFAELCEFIIDICLKLLFHLHQAIFHSKCLLLSRLKAK